MNEGMSAVRTGSAFAITVGVGYAACAFIFWLFPDAASTFMNALFHGLDFRRLQVGTVPFSFGGFFYALVALVVWVFVLGTLFASIRKRLA